MMYDFSDKTSMLCIISQSECSLKSGLVFSRCYKKSLSVSPIVSKTSCSVISIPLHFLEKKNI